MKSKLEYIWLDGYFPTQNMRSKTKLVDDFSGKLEDCQFGLLTAVQLDKRRKLFRLFTKARGYFSRPGKKGGYLVMTEVLNSDGTPHESNLVQVR